MFLLRRCPYCPIFCYFPHLVSMYLYWHVGTSESEIITQLFRSVLTKCVDVYIYIYMRYFLCVFFFQNDL